MGKAHGRTRRCKKKFNYKADRRKERKKEKKQKLSIQCTQIKNSWDGQKSLYDNFNDMGLSVDPNKTMPIPTAKDLLKPEKPKELQKEEKPPKFHVVKELEDEASYLPPSKFKVPRDQMMFAIYMMEKYDDDFKAMARDPKNYYQLTPKQIKRQINEFKNVPEQYNEYLKSKLSKEND